LKTVEIVGNRNSFDNFDQKKGKLLAYVLLLQRWPFNPLSAQALQLLCCSAMQACSVGPSTPVLHHCRLPRTAERLKRTALQRWFKFKNLALERVPIPVH
jgi:hypothetical protein